MCHKEPRNPRAAAILALTRFWQKPAPIRDFSGDALPAADRRLAMNIVYGVLRRRRYIESLISRLCRHPSEKLDVTLREALAVGLYQLVFLERIPEAAAVNETVAAAKQLGLPPHLTGVLNGSLRGAIRQRGTLPSPDGFLNYPVWLTERWRMRFGEGEMRRICAAGNIQPPLALRVNTRRCSPDRLHVLLREAGIAARAGRYAANALLLPDYQGAITSLPDFAEGLFHVQDEAAQLACALLGKSDEKLDILDACAGLGGKTATIAQLFPGALIQAVEPDTRRRELFAANRRRLDFAATLFAGTLGDYAQNNIRLFDRIFLDAPCSGTGVCARHPEIRWSRRAEELPRYQIGQLALLAQAHALLKPGGLLVYATCSLEAEENAEVISEFLGQQPDMMREDCRLFLPETAGGLVKDGFFQPRPSQRSDGFFAARLRQETGSIRSAAVSRNNDRL
ncbi:MAG TPA: 16S rRNA (cytosine(967)-C(5))-methyltransferase [Desulfobulbaceae bacterium]|nr:16S rRNA (cytosine(967)-C(5))-methyltransferase [Desulfobulbaceae bacterium]